MTNPQPHEIERVARALAKLVDGREDDWRDYEPEAETAIAAMQSASPATSDVVEALAALRREVAATEEHGDGAHDDSCPICLAIVKADAALNQSQQAEGRKP